MPSLPDEEAGPKVNAWPGLGHVTSLTRHEGSSACRRRRIASRLPSSAPACPGSRWRGDSVSAFITHDPSRPCFTGEAGQAPRAGLLLPRCASAAGSGVPRQAKRSKKLPRSGALCSCVPADSLPSSLSMPCSWSSTGTRSTAAVAGRPCRSRYRRGTASVPTCTHRRWSAMAAHSSGRQVATHQPRPAVA